VGDYTVNFCVFYFYKVIRKLTAFLKFQEFSFDYSFGNEDLNFPSTYYECLGFETKQTPVSNPKKTGQFFSGPAERKTGGRSGTDHWWLPEVELLKLQKRVSFPMSL
jgi:hypothetical protein